MRTFILAILLSLFISNNGGSQVHNFNVQYRQCNNCSGRIANCGNAAINDEENTNYTYGASQFYSTNQISSDYGPRRLGADLYDWHGGIDFTSGAGDLERGDLIIAIRQGSTRFYLDGNMKSIIIDNANDTFDFGYRHLFRRVNTFPVISGECALRRMLAPYMDETALIVPIINANDSITGHQVFGDIDYQNNNQDIGQVIWEGDTLTVGIMANTGDVIGPVGDSYASASILCAHLHLSCHVDNLFNFHDSMTKDPLTFVQHAIPTYQVRFRDQNNVNGVIIKYPGDTESSIRVRPTMQNEQSAVSVYQNSVANLDNVEIYISNFGVSVFRIIQGPVFYSNIAHGARPNIIRNPGSMIKDCSVVNGCHSNGQPRLGNWSRTGIDPFAYADAASHPYDDYYYADFVTRIHKYDVINDGSKLYADIPHTARYNDGTYNIFSRVTDVRGNHTSSDTLEFKLDNFKPFIEWVKVTINNTRIYEESWANQGDSCIQFSNTSLQTLLNAGDIAGGMTISVRASEQLDSIALHIPAFNIVNKAPVVNDTSTGYHYNFDITAAEVTVDSAQVRLKFTGTDVNDNSLISFDAGQLTTCFNIPLRATDTTWSDANSTDLQFGIDSIHSFDFNCQSVDSLGGNNSTARQTQGTVVSLLSTPIVLDVIITDANNNTDPEGSIDLIVAGGIAPYTYLWSDGSTTQDISEILSGEYCVTVTDGFCGYAEGCFTVGDDCPGIDPGTWEIVYPEDCGKTGYIYYNNDASGGTPEYDVYWTNAAGDLVPDADGSLIKKKDGIYTIHVVDADGCEVTEEVHLLAIPQMNTVLYIYTTASCVDANGNPSNNGTVTVAADPPGVILIYTWYDGTVEIGNSSIKEDLAPGNYCVTASSSDHNCTWELCEEVLSSEDLPLMSSPEVAHPCEAANGSIDLHISGGVPINGVLYKVTWSDGLKKDYAYRYNLENGTYSATITDHCEQELVETIILDGLDAEFVVVPGCDGGMGSVDVIISGGVSPYTVTWTDGYNGDLPRMDMIPGIYSLTIMDTTGCTQYRDVEVHSVIDQIQIIEQIDACEGFSDGEITLQIDNPFGDQISGWLYPVNPCVDCGLLATIYGDENPLIFKQIDLEGNTDYEFTVNIGGCILTFPFTINQLDLQNEYLGHDEIEPDIYVCYYDQICRDHRVDTALVELAWMENEDCEWDQLDCPDIIYRCGVDEVARKTQHRQEMRRGEAIILAQQLPWVSQGLIDVTLEGNWCDRVNVCPNDPTCGLSQSAGGQFGGTWIENEYDPDTGCVRVRCRIFWFISTSYTICGVGPDQIPDVVPDYIQPYIDWDFQHDVRWECHPSTNNVGALVHFMDNHPLDVDYPGFEGSELEDFLIDHQNDPARWCAEVTYCADSFTIVSHDIDLITCPVIDPPLLEGNYLVGQTCDPLYNYLEPPGAYVACWENTDCQDMSNPDCHLFWKFVDLDYTTFELLMDNPSEIQIVQGGLDANTYFQRFATLKQTDGFTWANGIYESKNGLIYHPFHPERFRLIESNDDIEFIHHAPEENFLFTVLREERPANFTIACGNTQLDLVEKTISSSSGLSFDKISYTDGLAFISGQYSGKLYYDNNILSESATENRFVLLLNDDLQISDFFQFGFDVILSGSTDEQYVFVVNDIPENSSRSGHAGPWQQINLKTGEKSLSPWQLKGETRLIDFIISPDYSFYAFHGNGQIVCNNNTLSVDNDEITLVCLGDERLYQWHKIFKGHVDTDNFTIEKGPDHAIYCAVNFTGKLLVTNHSINSIGGEDILISHFSKTGELLNKYHYGSPDDEIVKDMYQSQGSLFIGGEFSGNTFERQLGALTFANFNTPYTHAFVSYLPRTNEEHNNDVLHAKNNSDDLATIYPNPVTDVLNIEFNEALRKEAYNLTLYHINGRLIWNRAYKNTSSNKNISIDMSALPAGVYLLKIESPSGIISTYKSIIL